MKKQWGFHILWSGAFVLLLAVALRAFAQPNTAPAGSDSQPDGLAEVVIPAQFQPGPEAVVGGPGSTEVYFTPQDENTSTTVIFLYNTGTTTATVGIETYGLDGSTYINTAVDVPGPGMVRIAGDAVSTVSGTWSNAILVNFTTSSTYAKLIVPAGVKAEAYVAWNGGATYDPLVEVETLPIRFSTDPATLFLPTIE